MFTEDARFGVYMDGPGTEPSYVLEGREALSPVFEDLNPEAGHHVIAQFVAHGFAGAIKAWLSDSSVAKGDLVDVAVACAPVWWT